MAPQRKTNADDSRPEPGTKEKTLYTSNAGVSKGKKTAGSSLRDITNSSSNHTHEATSGVNGSAGETGEAIKFYDLSRCVLHSYRAAHHLPVPSSFANFNNQMVLSNPNSIGKLSPTMNRLKEKRRISKETLARAVRRDFMDQSVNELEVEASACYIIRNGEKTFRMRFMPQSKK